jgi:hypothetical protein
VAIDRDQIGRSAKAGVDTGGKESKEATGVEFSKVVDEAQDGDAGRNM